MAPPDTAQRLRDSLARRTKPKRPPGRRKFGVELPTQYRVESDEEEIDVCAPSSGMALNQSIFGLIAAAGSVSALRSTPGESDEDEEDSSRISLAQTVPSLGPAALGDTASGASDVSKVGSKSRKGLLGKPFKRLLPIKERKTGASTEDMMSSSQILPPRQPESELTRESEGADGVGEKTLSNAPILSRILNAEARMREQAEENKSSKNRPGSPRQNQLSLAKEVQRMFKFKEMQDVIAEYRCSLVSGAVCPGYLFVTKRYICFYACLPQPTAKSVQSGHLSKRGIHDPRYHRYYCELKGHVLSFYEDPTHINYPRSFIDMRRGISVFSLEHEKNKDGTHFTLETDKRDYQLRADNVQTAKDWVNILKQEILSTHNDGGLVKITLPVENILDIEQNHIRGMAVGADSARIRVVDSDETFAIDEYYFTFERDGEDAIRQLKLTHQNFSDRTNVDAPTSETSSNHVRLESSTEHLSVVPVSTSRKDSPPPSLPQSPRKLSPPSSKLGEDSRRSSLDARRANLNQERNSSDDGSRSISQSQHQTQTLILPKWRESMGSPTSASFDPDTESSVAIQSMEETIDGSNASESQILNSSNVFKVPTIHATGPQRAKTEGQIGRLQRTSQDTERMVNLPPDDESKPKRPTPLARMSAGGLSLSEQDTARMQGSNYSIGRLMKASMSPLQSASGLAGFLGKQSKQMSSLLASESMGYYEKVAGMWHGGARHYGGVPGSRPDDHTANDQDESRQTNDTLRFREHFALPESEQLVASWHCYQQRTLPLYGKLYLGSTHLCWRPLMARTTKMKLPLKVLETVVKGTSYRLGYAGMCVVVAGDEEVFFDFKDGGLRDDCVVTILLSLHAIDPSRQLAESGILSEHEIIATEVAKAEHRALQEARRATRTDEEDDEPEFTAESMMIDGPKSLVMQFKPPESLRITCLTIGSRGDVQPYIALCKGLLADGHKPRIATHAEFGDWVKGHGIDFEPIEGDPAVLMQLCVENGMFTLSFMKEATLHFRVWIDGLMASAWKACQNSDVIIESPSAMVGIHISEALQVPYFRAFTMPWTRTRAFPHAFFVPNSKAGGTYNYMTYTLFDSLFWKSTAGQINNWRKSMLSLKPTSLSRLEINKVPFLYNFSKFVVRQPLDWSDWVRITGYWFLDEEQEKGWVPPVELVDFIAKARKDGKKLVYIGFGSITVDSPALLTETVVKAVMGNDLRCVLSKGWSDRLVKTTKSTATEVPLPPEILQVRYSVPHSWLFPQMDAVTHHGGAGTTGASLRAGKPTIIKPFFGDQYFFGSRVEDLGVGIYVRIMNEKKFGRALYYATHDERIRKKAKWIGEQIRSEDGVSTAIHAIYRDLEYARSLVRRKVRKNNAVGGGGEIEGDLLGEENEEWTLISEDSGPEDVDGAKRVLWDAKEQGLVVDPDSSKFKE